MEKDISDHDKKIMLQTLKETPWSPNYDSQQSYENALAAAAVILEIDTKKVTDRMLTAYSIFGEEIFYIKSELLEELNKK